MKNFKRFDVFSYGRLADIRNFLALCIEEEIPMMLAKQFLDDLFNKTMPQVERIKRADYMTLAKYGKPCCPDGDKK